MHAWRHAQSVTKRALISTGDGLIAGMNLASEVHEKAKAKYAELAAKCEKAVRAYDAALSDAKVR